MSKPPKQRHVSPSPISNGTHSKKERDYKTPLDVIAIFGTIVALFVGIDAHNAAYRVDANNSTAVFLEPDPLHNDIVLAVQNKGIGPARHVMGLCAVRYADQKQWDHTQDAEHDPKTRLDEYPLLSNAGPANSSYNTRSCYGYIPQKGNRFSEILGMVRYWTASGEERTDTWRFVWEPGQGAYTSASPTDADALYVRHFTTLFDSYTPDDEKINPFQQALRAL